MAKHGFIYLLGNKAMPCYYKLGCTERSPHARAAELSGATGVPEPFTVLLYIEVEDFQRREQCLHGHLCDFRPSMQREFFVFGPNHLPWVYALFRHYPHRLAFAECHWEGDLELSLQHESPWESDPEAPDGLYMTGPTEPPIQHGGLRLVA